MAILRGDFVRKDGSHSDSHMSTSWSAQVNDLVGGWIVTDYPAPHSAHDFNKDGDPAKRGYIIAECMTEQDASTIAKLLNDARYERPIP